MTTRQLAVRLTGAAIVAGVLAGMGVLAWGLARGSGGDDGESAPLIADLPLPSPVTTPLFTKEQALVIAANEPVLPDLRSVAVQVTTMRGAIPNFGPGYTVDTPTEYKDFTAWLVREWGFGISDAYGLPGTTTGCEQYPNYFADGNPKASSDLLRPDVPDLDNCDLPFSRELAIVVAAFNLQHQYTEDLFARIPGRVTAVHVSLDDALSLLDSKGIEPTALPTNASRDEDVWVITLTGPFISYSGGYLMTGEPAPTPEPFCATVIGVLFPPRTMLASDLSKEEC